VSLEIQFARAHGQITSLATRLLGMPVAVLIAERAGTRSIVALTGAFMDQAAMLSEFCRGMLLERPGEVHTASEFSEKAKAVSNLGFFAGIRLHNPETGVAWELAVMDKAVNRALTDSEKAALRELCEVAAASEVQIIEESRDSKPSWQQVNEMLHAVVSASPLAILAIGVDGKVTLWNRAAERMFGWTEEEALGKPIPYIPPEKLEEHREMRGFDLKGLSFTGIEVRRRRKDGAPIDLSVSTAPMRDELGGICGIMTICMDITRQKRLEDELRQAQKMESVGRLAGGIAHDFNNLLTVVSGYSQMLVDGASADETKELAAEILNAAQRAADLTSQLLAFSRRRVFQTEILSLDEEIRSMESFLRRALGERVELLTELGDVAGRVKADRIQIEQVVMNLAINARDAMPDGGNLNVKTRPLQLADGDLQQQLGLIAGRYVVLSVSDSGHGIDPEIRSNIFEPFFTTKEPGKGTGLGLATVYGIVKQHGGGIRLESFPGGGTTFEIYLPATEGSCAPKAPATPSYAGGGHETILLVEDEEPLRRMVAGMLSREGYTVVEASDAEEALSLCERSGGNIELVLADVVMPRMGGAELVNRLKSLRPLLKILLMSGYLDYEVSGVRMLDGSTPFLRKPFTKEALTGKIRQILESPV
jgi:two-component system cell cycle sensor histidine kinase/response regulator CckA